jgi:predicted ATPase
VTLPLDRPLGRRRRRTIGRRHRAGGGGAAERATVGATIIRTPDQRLRVFVSSTLGELAAERAAVRAAIEQLRLVPVMFELGARPHPPRELYRAYLAQSQVFVGIYWQRYGWVAPGEDVSGLEDEYRLGRSLPGLFYLKEPAPDRDPALRRLLDAVRDDDRASYRRFGSPEELTELVLQDLAVLLSERFESASSVRTAERRFTAPATALPAPLGSLVGRERELAAVAQLLDAGARLVTVTGPGGIGKTRLALAIAHEVAPRYPDGVLLVSLAEVEDAGLVLPTVASRLGLRLTGAQRAGPAVAEHLAGRRALLVLDNLEQVIAVGPELAVVLERAPDVQVLATSRRPLGIVGEQEWRLDPLVVPPADANPDELAMGSAVELFVDRARAVDPTFGLHPGNVADVAELCRRLEGLPLAIELAAARVRLFPPAALLRRLGDRLELLAGGADRPERHRTLRATIEWSIRLLTPRDRAVLARLSVFAGGCTLDAAEEVCDPEGERDVVDAVARLLDHGLLMVGDDRQDDEPRVRMLETVRVVAADELERRGETTTLRRRHLGWYAALVERAQPYLCGPHQRRWLARIDPERANLRLAARHGLQLGEPGTVLELGWDLYVYYHVRGAHQEPEAWVAAAAAEEGLDERQRAIAVTAAAISALWRGEVTAAQTELEAALPVFSALRLPFELAVAELNLASCALATGDAAGAVGLASAAAQRFTTIGHDWGVGSSDLLRGAAAAALGDRAAAVAALERAMEAGRRIDNATVRAQASLGLGDLAVSDGDLDGAWQRTLDAVGPIVEVRDLGAVAGCLELVAELAFQRGERQLAGAALAAADRTRVRTELARPPTARSCDHLVHDEVVARARDREATEDPFEVLQATVRALSPTAVS